MILIASIISFFVSLIGVRIYTGLARKKGLLDIPNARSSHTAPTPRGGGIVFIVLWLISLFVFWLSRCINGQQCALFFIPSLLIAAISFIDDNISLSARWRFGTQLFAVLIALGIIGPIPRLSLQLFGISSLWLNFILALLICLWSTNLFNFMDGMDGLAASAAAIVLSMQAYLLYRYGALGLTVITCVLAAAILGFLIWNWPRAKVFMGDVGSATLGLILAIIALYAQKFYNIPIILWVMLYGVFLFDATITLVRRLLHKEKWYEAHKSHAYQRLHQSGWSHLKVLLGFLGLNLVIVSLVFIATYYIRWTFALAVVELVILGIIYSWIETQRAMYQKNV
jgi:Fuc2NAc and GlcNAc transferase